MIKRENMTRPRIRLSPGEDPHAKLKAIYAMGQLDKPLRGKAGGHGSVRINGNGELVGGPTGFTGIEPPHRKNQDPVDRHGPGYDDDTPPGWTHSRAESKPDFDNRHHHFKNTASGPRNKASGADAKGSPFSAAHFKGRGER